MNLIHVYDDNNNVSNIINRRDSALSINNRYDVLNQLTYSSGSWGNASFEYDAFGNLKRVKQVVNGETIYSVYTLGSGLIRQYNKTTHNLADDIILL